MPLHIDDYQARQYVDSLLRKAADTCVKHNIPFDFTAAGKNYKPTHSTPQNDDKT